MELKRLRLNLEGLVCVGLSWVELNLFGLGWAEIGLVVP